MMIMPRNEAPFGNRRRSHQACLNCRRKKSRCPGEKPICSICARLGQTCVYAARDPRQSERLACLEEKVDIIFNGHAQKTQYPLEGCVQASSGSFENQMKAKNDNVNSRHYSGRLNHQNASEETNYPSISPMLFQLESLDWKLEISSAALSRGIELYFESFHRQPIWLFDREDLEPHDKLSSDVVYGILELTERFSHEKNRPQYGESARWLIMLRVANQTVELGTVQSLCLLSYSAFIDGDLRQGQFYLGFAFQLCQSTRIDRNLTKTTDETTNQREKRLLWSLQTLEQFYREQEGILGTAPEFWRSYYVTNDANQVFPLDNTSSPQDIGIWSFAIHFGWVWSRAREYTFQCSHKQLVEPWRLDSVYAKILADMMEIENKVPWCHRYDCAKIYERHHEEIQLNRFYWIPWLKLQFTWHAILIVINHPFLYITASQHHPNLSIPNTFWRKSSEIVLLHATWIVRMIDIVIEKQVHLTDPFFGHAAAIAATVHLYFSCASDSRLQRKSKMDFEKCKAWLSSFADFSTACETLVHALEKMYQKSFGLECIELPGSPSKIHLSIPLLWGILQYDISRLQEINNGFTAMTSRDSDKSQADIDSTLEVIVTLSPPEVTIDTSTGHNGVLPPYMASSSSTPSSINAAGIRDIFVPPADSFMFNIPWSGLDPSQFPETEEKDTNFEARANAGSVSSWLDFGTL